MNAESNAGHAPRYLTSLELGLLALFAISLPLFEAPKNILWALFVVSWFVIRLRRREFGHLGLGWNLVFAGLIAAPALSIALSPFTPQWKEMGDIVGYVSLGYLLARSRLAPRQVWILSACLILATLLGVLHGFWVLNRDPQRLFLQLNSVGHVNHSAIYASGVALLALSGALLGGRTGGRGTQLLWILSALLMFGAMIAFASRSALLGYAFGAAVLLLLQARLKARHYLALATALIVLGAAAQWLTSRLIGGRNPYSTVIAKTISGFKEGQLASYRGQLWQVALEGFRQAPLSGIGAASFRELTLARIRAGVEGRGETFVAERYLADNVHAHGLYANIAAERGLVGLLALAAFGLLWLHALRRRRPPPDAPATASLAWGAAVGAWCMVFVGGLFNTTLHHEHGMLATLLLGLMLAHCPPTSTGKPA